MADDPILELIRGIREDLQSSRDESRESRARQHKRLDEVYDRLGRIDTSLALSGEVDAQVRKELDDLRASMAALAAVVEAQAPTTREWNLAKRLGTRFVTWLGVVMAGVGMTVGAWFLGLLGQVWDFVRAALRLS